MEAAFDARAQVPLSHVRELRKCYGIPQFGAYLYEKVKGETKEEMNDWTKSLVYVFAIGIDQVLNTTEHKEKKPTFGYLSKDRDGDLGCDIVYGFDYG